MKALAREYTESILVAVVVAVLVRTFILSAYRIPTASMAPTLKAGDFIFAYQLPYGFHLPWTQRRLGARLPQRGEVVVFYYPGNEGVRYVKRVVGLPGDEISLDHNHLMINGEPARYGSEEHTLIADLPGHEYYDVRRESIKGMEHFVMLAKDKSGERFGPKVVPEGQVFVLGDNRDSSDDSRDWGMVPIENIQGRVCLIWLSWDWHSGDSSSRLASFPRLRWERLFSSIH